MINNNIYNYINDIHLPIGETKRMNCPVCNGYNTFTITNEMGSLKWNCYKASCTVSGSKKVALSMQDIRSVIDNHTEEKEDTFVLPEHIVSAKDNDDVLEWLDHWSITELKNHVMYDVKEHRVVFPCTNNGKVYDAAGRAMGKRLPKWKRYGQSGLPYSFGCGKSAVVVEDCVSASAVGIAPPFTGVALLGTSLTESTKRFLSQFSTAVVALDPDALPKTIKIAKELGPYVSNVKVLRLTDDLKYRNTEDWNSMFELVGANHNGIISCT